MASWYLAASLKNLLGEVNAVHPKRSRASDGSVGDTAHSARKSDHNPAPPTMVVRAIDITNEGINVDALIMCAISDWRVEYVISRGLIYKRSNGFKPERYTGSNRHDKHVHISIRHGKSYEDSQHPWEYAKRAGFKPPASNGGSSIPTPGTSTQGKAVDDVAVIYMAGKSPGFGVLASNGGWAGLASAEEKKNLMAAGVKEVWIEERTLSYLIKDSRGLIRRQEKHYINE